MHNDLAQMSKAKGIYRTLSLLAILSHKPVASGTNKYALEKESHEATKQVNVGHMGDKYECLASPR
jgi:hypothetical protein